MMIRPYTGSAANNKYQAPGWDFRKALAGILCKASAAQPLRCRGHGAFEVRGRPE
jgi:hypothetical protein